MKRIKLTTVLLVALTLNVYSIDFNDLDADSPELATNLPELALNNTEIDPSLLELASNNMDAVSSDAHNMNTRKDSVRTTRTNYISDNDILNLKFNTLKYNPPKAKNSYDNLELLPMVNQGLTISEPLELNLNMHQLSIGLYNSNKNELSFWNKISSKRSTNLDTWERMKIIGMYSAAIICNSIGDGMNNTNRKTMGHVLNAASIGFLVASPFVIKYEKQKWYYYLLTYTSLRLAFFDAGYNLTTDKPIDYIGSTAITDKLYKAAGVGYNLSKSVGFLLGVTIPLKFI